MDTVQINSRTIRVRSATLRYVVELAAGRKNRRRILSIVRIPNPDGTTVWIIKVEDRKAKR